MKLENLVPLVIVGFAMTATVAAAGEMSPAGLDNGARAAPIIQAAFGDGPPTGPRHAKRRHAAETTKDTGPSKIDMHGATREGADQAYRKKYGF